MSLSSKIFNITEGVGIAFDAIRSNKVRAALTILGVAVGVFVVVALSAAIHGINASVAKDLESAGPGYRERNACASCSGTGAVRGARACRAYPGSWSVGDGL